MFVKVFAQILDSSIADDHLTRWVFEDLLKLADKDGVVDMTLGAIARRTNVPLEIVTMAVAKLMDPDPTSRSLDEDGRRIVPIDPQRPWGWRIVNYLHYRNIRDGEERKAYFRERKREQRSRSKIVQDGGDSPRQSPNVTEAEAEAEAGSRKQKRGAPLASAKGYSNRCAEMASVILDHRRITSTPMLIDVAAQSIWFAADKEERNIAAAAAEIEQKIEAAQSRCETVNLAWFQNSTWKIPLRSRPN